MRRVAATAAVLVAGLTGCSAAEPKEPDVTSRWPLVQGVALTSYSETTYAQSSQYGRLAALGAEDVQLVPRWGMERKTGSSITPQRDSPTEADITAGVRAAKAAGLRVMVKPHVDVADGTFRGEIAPKDRTTWWRDYRDYVLRYARAAATGGADFFTVGTELSTMVRDTARWTALIADVRRVFRGPVTYAANWDGVEDVGFWDALDAIGVDAYYPLTGDLAAAWAERVAELEELVEREDRPVVFTEVGYPSEQGAARHPFSERKTTPDEALQARLYGAVFAAFADERWWRGAYFWDWRADGTAPTPTGYEPTGKAAEDVLRQAWRRPTG